MEVTVNGQARTVPDRCTVAQLIELIEFSGGRVAVERNQEVVPRATYAHMTLEPGDRLEIVSFIGGGQ
jgi:thiamine biosynthesis protein ThiS